MIRYLAAVVVAAAATAARADTLPLFAGLPGTYVPGVAFTFEVRAPGVADLGAYNVELVLTADPGAIAALAATTAFPADPAASPFGVADNFLVGGPFAAGGEVRLTLSDFTLGAGAATTAGVNDLLAVVTVTPGVGFSGPLTIGVDLATLQFDTAAGDPIPVDPPAEVVVVASAGPNSPVPAPPGLLLAAVGAAGLVGIRRLRRHSSTCRSPA